MIWLAAFFVNKVILEQSYAHISILCGCFCALEAELTEKAMAPHSSTLAWKIPWMEKPGRLQSMGLLRVRHDWATSLSLFTFMHRRRKWQPIPVFLPGESQGREPGGLPSMGSHRVEHDWSDLAAAAEPSSWDRDPIAWKAENAYHLALYRKKLQSTAPG